MQWDLLWPLIDDKTEGGAVLCWGLLPFTHQLALQIRAGQKEEQNEVWNQFEYLNICEVCNLGEKMTLKFWWKAKSDNDKKIQREPNGNWPVEATAAALGSRLLLWSHLARRRHGLGMNSQTGNCQCFAYLCNTISRFNYCVTLGLRTIVKHHGPLFLKSGTFATLLFPVL